MRASLLLLALACCALSPSAAPAAPAPASSPASGTVELMAYTFAHGGTLPSLKLHYLTLGRPRRDAAGHITNAVLLLHGTMGSAETMLQPRFVESLYGPGQPLDAEKVFLVIPDGIGAGGSSKPSDGLRTRFPHYGYVDQVRTQHALVERLGVAHLDLVLGTSMGGMQTWLWAEMYPEAADAYVAIAATPAPISGRNEMWRDMIVQSIRDDPDWKGGDYPKDHPPRAWLHTAMPLFSIMTSNADVLNKEAPTLDGAIRLVDALEAKGESRDADDLLYLYESSFDYDPVPALAAIKAPMLAIDFADDLLNPPELLDLPRTPNETNVLLPAGARSYGHETLAHPEVWAPSLAAFLAKRPDRPR